MFIGQEIRIARSGYEQSGPARSSGVGTYEDVGHFVSAVWWEMERSEKISE